MRALLVAVLGLLIATPGVAQEKEKKGKRQTNLITFEEIDAIQAEASDAYAVIQRLRPQFLRIRGGGQSLGPAEPIVIRVVVDNAPRGALEILRQIPSNSIREIRYLNAADASIQFGTGYAGGAILVFTR